MQPGECRDGRPAGEEGVVICRCEDVTLGEIRRLIAEGARTLDEIKRLTRAGMGLCQGRTCRHLILQEVARLTGVPVEELALPTFRPPTRPVRLGVIARAAARAGTHPPAAPAGATPPVATARPMGPAATGCDAGGDDSRGGVPRGEGG